MKNRTQSRLLLAALTVAVAATSANGQWTPLSDFECATLGSVEGQLGWSTNTANTTAFYNVAADPSNPSNQVLEATGTSGGAPSGNAYLSFGANSIADSTTGTVFWRMRNSDLGDLVAGAIDVPVPESWPDYEGYMVMASTGGVNQFRVRDGGGFTDVGEYTGDEWYNIWIVLDHTADTTALYVSQGTDAASLLGTGGFRTGNEPNDTLSGINIRMGSAQLTNSATGYLDDFYIYNSGQNLTIPEGISNPALPGDVDLDGDVDVDDYIAIRDHFRQVVSDPTDGDLTGPQGVRDGFVDFYDFGEWKANAPASVLAQVFGVPEPTTACLAAAVGLCVVTRRRR